MRPAATLEVSDIVRIARLLHPSRDVDGSSVEPTQPRVGERGMVVDLLGDDLYLVERTTDDGRTLWLAEFHERELELLDRPA